MSAPAGDKPRTQMRTPRTLDQATAMAARFAELDTRLAQIEAERRSQTGQINAACDAVAGPITQELADIARCMAPWWAKHGVELTKGKRKSAELGGCMIGARAQRARLAHGFDNDELALAALIASPYRKGTVAVRYAINRTATLKLLDGTGAVAKGLAALGFRSEQPEEAFYIARVEQGGTISS